MLIFCSINYWFSCQLSPWLKSIECDCQMLTRVTIQMKVALSESLSGIAFLETVSSKVTVKWLKGRLICVALAMTNSFQRKKNEASQRVGAFFFLLGAFLVFFTFFHRWRNWMCCPENGAQVQMRGIVAMKHRWTPEDSEIDFCLKGTNGQSQQWGPLLAAKRQFWRLKFARCFLSLVSSASGLALLSSVCVLY